LTVLYVSYLLCDVRSEVRRPGIRRDAQLSQGRALVSCLEFRADTERRGDTLKGFKDFYRKVKAIIWP